MQTDRPMVPPLTWIDFGYCSAAIMLFPVTSPSTEQQCRGHVAKSKARPHHQKRLFVKQV
jgi:hypothetical protein